MCPLQESRRKAAEEECKKHGRRKIPEKIRKNRENSRKAKAIKNSIKNNEKTGRFTKEAPHAAAVRQHFRHLQHVLIHVSASAAIAAIVSVAEEQKQDYPQAAVISAATAPVGISVSAAAQQKKDPQDIASAGISVSTKQSAVSGITSASTVCSS